MLACLCNWSKLHNHFFSGFLPLQLHFLYTHFICIDLLCLLVSFCFYSNIYFADSDGGHILSPFTLLIPIPDLSCLCLFTSLLPFTILFLSALLSSTHFSSSPFFPPVISPPLIFPPFSSPLFYMDTMSCCSSAACQWRLRL